MDDIDRAQELEEQQRAQSLAAHRRSAADRGTLWCIDCDEVIPWQRRRAQPGATRCIDCQTRHETHQRLGLI